MLSVPRIWRSCGPKALWRSFSSFRPCQPYGCERSSQRRRRPDAAAQGAHRGEGSIQPEDQGPRSGARRRYEELRGQRDRAIRFFNSNTEALYETAGRLIIDITSTGFRFDVEIERARSAGVSNMKVFAFDITLTQLWSQHPQPPGFVIHDSLLYDGVDETQKALALDLAAREAEARG